MGVYTTTAARTQSMVCKLLENTTNTNLYDASGRITGKYHQKE